MTVAFVSNYINHHQIPFCDALFKRLGDNFTFIQTVPMEEERIKLGWNTEGEKKAYVKLLYNDDKVINLINDCDILLAGWFDDMEVVDMAVRKRVKANKPTFRISERLYKTGRWKAVSPRGLIHKYKEYTRYRRNRYYLLCAGSYVAGDFKLFGAFPGKKYRWGYFPVMLKYGEDLWEKKRVSTTVRICWSGRFIDWKHPDVMLRLAGDLKKLGYSFHLNMIGTGELGEDLKKMAVGLGIEEMVTFGVYSPEGVREIMEDSHIFVSTSDYREGWGVVVNEAMNSGCAVVAGAKAGCSNYLIDSGKNGFVYLGNKYGILLEMVKQLIDEPELREKMGRAAYQTIASLWNAENAAAELIRVCFDVMAGREIIAAKEGPFARG